MISMECTLPLRSEAHSDLAMSSGINTYKNKYYLPGVSISFSGAVFTFLYIFMSIVFTSICFYTFKGAVFPFPHSVSLPPASPFRLSTGCLCAFVFMEEGFLECSLGT